jgi:non-homologous end joining protein Ku
MRGTLVSIAREEIIIMSMKPNDSLLCEGCHYKERVRHLESLLEVAPAQQATNTQSTSASQIADKMEWMLLGEDSPFPLQVKLCIRDWCQQLRTL